MVLHPGSFENNLFELDYSISKKRVSVVKTSQEDVVFFCMIMKYFFEILTLFHMSKQF